MRTRRKGGFDWKKYLAALFAVQQTQKSTHKSTHVVASRHNSTLNKSSVYSPKEVWVHDSSHLDRFDEKMMKIIEERYAENARSSVKKLIEGDRMEKVFFTINGTRIETAFSVGKKKIDILPTIPDGKKTCVNMQIDKRPMYLSNFYYYTKMHQCPTTSHADIFNLFDAISSVYKKPIDLYDASTKKVHDHKNCIFDKLVMAMAKGRTFYNIYGFQNKAFTEALMKTQPIQLTSGSKLALLYEELSNSNADDVSLKQAAEYAIKNCQHQNNQKMLSFIDELGREIKRQLKRHGLEEDEDEFTRPTSENEYTVSITKEPNHYEVQFETLAKSIW